MFTGLIEEIGIIVAINKTHTGIALGIKTQGLYLGTKVGDSIAVSGVCLSVTNLKDKILTFDVIQETIRKTTFGELKINDSVNLERSLRADSRIGGHFVTGHIDYKAKLVEIEKSSNEIGLKVSFPEGYSKFVVEKGSIALDGVSLTVVDVLKDNFKVYLIPHTLKATTLGEKRKGDLVNVETDLLAKYLTEQTKKSDLETLLKKYQYI